MKLTYFLREAAAALYFLGAFVPSITAVPVQLQQLTSREPAAAVSPELPRLVIYYQTTHDSDGRPISMLPLITEKNIALTHLIVCSFHVVADGGIHLNDYPPDHSLFYTLWNETQVMKSAGVKIMGMVGGAAAGSFTDQTLDARNADVFERAYAQLHDTIQLYQLDGMDLDVEQPMSLPGIVRLVRRLRSDFGPDFIITLAPVASALHEGANLSGFDYKSLERIDGADISFYNAQFYNGFGDMQTPKFYEAVVTDWQGWHPSRILAGQITTPANGGGFVSFDKLNETIVALSRSVGGIGGIMGWEYFNSESGIPEREPWRWAQVMTAILRPNLFRELVVTRSTADRLVESWRESVSGWRANSVNLGVGVSWIPDDLLTPNVDYLGMVNA
ncbi:endo-N-acetyl-beta-D-glucosaminidase precursor [Apodospora peruviana]|uniref:Endo-N-acetyl-beta-D-glucosaminidase n=1 Tax=Apodospora peruviana TaxID=516989 RepID=A0AAE0HUN3_9PEZI|nr:endo-N-acetyl-beta-D-glucosaminidase precursor [Apodospora peruviana]